MAMAIWPTRTDEESPRRALTRSGRVDTDDGEIAIGVVADQRRGVFPAVGKDDIHRERAMDDVAVCKNESIRGYDEARSRCQPTSPEPLPFPARCRTSIFTTQALTFSTVPITASE